MQESVPSPSVAQSTLAATLFDEWVRAGLTDVVLCPGSRSTPLSLAAARAPGVAVHVRLDERSAGFFALGRALATARPVVIVVTSGTAAAELHAAVAEADLARVPLIVVTADRPPELHGVGAAQTIDQRHLYGAMARRFEEPGVARAEASATWRPLASRLWNCAAGATGPAGPVHLNLAFVEPLIAAPGELPAPRANGAPWNRVEPSPPRPARPRGARTPRPRRRRSGDPAGRRRRVRRVGLGRRGRRDGARVPGVRRPAAARRRVRLADAPRPRRAPRRDSGVARRGRSPAVVGCGGRRPSRRGSGRGPRRRRVREPRRRARRGRPAPARRRGLRGSVARRRRARGPLARRRRRGRGAARRARRGARGRVDQFGARRAPGGGLVDARAGRRMVGARARRAYLRQPGSQRHRRGRLDDPGRRVRRRGLGPRRGPHVAARHVRARRRTGRRRGLLRPGRHRQPGGRHLFVPSPGARAARAGVRPPSA